MVMATGTPCGEPVGFWVILPEHKIEVRCAAHCFTDEVLSSDSMQDEGAIHKDAPRCQYIDMAANTRNLILAIVNTELNYQDDKFGEHRILPPSKWISVPLEELGEAARALNDNDWEVTRAFLDEMVQCAASSIQVCIQLTREHGIMPQARYFDKTGGAGGDITSQVRVRDGDVT